MPVRAERSVLCVILSLSGLWTSTSAAQELVPRAYWPAPVGTNLLVVGYQHLSGDVVTDATLPLEGVESTFEYFQVSYQRTLNVLGRTSNLQFNLPYARGSATGLVEGEFRRRDISSFADARLQFSINLRGAPSMDNAAFRELVAKPRTIVAASVLVQPPTGSYDVDRAINAGSNRWSSKFGVGAIWPLAPGWLFEASAGVWYFGDNDEFLGATRQQDPIFSGEVHLVRTNRSGLWVALDGTYYSGGQTTVDGVVRDDRQQNARIGVTLLYPIKRHHAIRLALSTAIRTEIGGEYDSISLNYAKLWQ